MFGGKGIPCNKMGKGNGDGSNKQEKSKEQKQIEKENKTDDTTRIDDLNAKEESIKEDWLGQKVGRTKQMQKKLLDDYKQGPPYPEESYPEE